MICSKTFVYRSGKLCQHDWKSQGKVREFYSCKAVGTLFICELMFHYSLNLYTLLAVAEISPLTYTAISVRCRFLHVGGFD